MRLLIAFLLLTGGLNAQIMPGFRVGVSTAPVAAGGGTVVAKFNFNLTAQSISGWTDVTGHPHSGIRTATDGTSGVGVSSIATTMWTPFASNTASNTGGDATGNSKFPSSVASSRWYMYYNSTAATEAYANLRITGLNEAKTYKIEIFSTRAAAGISSTYGRMTIYLWHNGGQTNIINYDVKANTSETAKTSAGTGIGGGIATFNSVAPKAGGILNLMFNPKVPVTTGEDFAQLNAMIITEL